MKLFRPICRHGFLVLGLLLAGCSQSGLVQKFSDPEKVKVAEAYLAQLKTGDLEKLAGELDVSVRGEKALENLRTMRAMIPGGPPDSTELVGYHWQTVAQLAGGRESTYSVTHQLRHGDKWLLVLLAWREKDAVRRITAFRVVPLEKSLQETHAFRLRDIDLIRALFLAGAVAVPVFILVTLVACIRTRMPKHKWLWIIFILVGFTQLSINWTTGVVGFRPLAFQLLGAGAMAQPFMAWMISISIPAGAIAFWIRRRDWLAASAATAAEPPPIQIPEA